MTDRDDGKVIRREWLAHPVLTDLTADGVVVGVDHGGTDGAATLVVLSVDGQGRGQGYRPVLVIVDDPHDDAPPDPDRLREVLRRWVEACDGLRDGLQDLAHAASATYGALEELLQRLKLPELRLPDELRAELDQLTRRAATTATSWPLLRRPPPPPPAWPTQPTRAMAWHPHTCSTARRRRGPWTLPRTPA